MISRQKFFAVAALLAGWMLIPALAQAQVDPDLMVYEPFDYTFGPSAGNNFLWGKGAGSASDIGWQAAGAGSLWNNAQIVTDPSTTPNVNPQPNSPRMMGGNLAYPAGTSTATPRGNSVFNHNDVNLQMFQDRHFAMAIGDDEAVLAGQPVTRYFSALVQTNYSRQSSDIRLGIDGDAATSGNAVPVTIPSAVDAGGSNVAFGFYGGGNFPAGNPNYGNGSYGVRLGATVIPAAPGSPNPPAGTGTFYNQPAFLLAEMTFDGTANANSDTVKLYLNPNPTPGSGALLVNTTTQLGTFNEMRFQMTSPTNWDEIRIGKTWASMFSNELGGGPTPQAVGGGTVIARGTKDTGIDMTSTGVNGGGSAGFRPKDNQDNVGGRVLVDFQDVHSLVGAGKTITSAYLILEKTNSTFRDLGGPTGLAGIPQDQTLIPTSVYNDMLKVFRVGAADPWTEGTDINNQGTVDSPGGATWAEYNRNGGANLWSYVGGAIFDTTGHQLTDADIASAESVNNEIKMASRNNQNPYAYADFQNDAQSLELDVTQMIQEWYDFVESGGSSGFDQNGMMLTAWGWQGIGGQPGAAFMSMQTPGAYANGLEPHLVITYQSSEAEVVPEPSTLVLAVISLLGLTWFGIRRRNR